MSKILLIAASMATACKNQKKREEKGIVTKVLMLNFKAKMPFPHLP
jgi:hypothetical protein